MPDNLVGESVRLHDVAVALWRRRWLFCVIAFCFCAAGILYALLATPWYRAETLLLPSEHDQRSRIAGQFGGLGALVGITGFNFGGSNSTEAIALLGSDGFTATFISDEKLLPVLFSEEWDATAGKWKDSDPENHPDLRDGIRYFSNNVRGISLDPQTGLVTVTVDWTNPQQAALWANLMVDRLNQHMQQRALSEAKRNVAYLQSELEKSNVAPLRQSISNLLQAELEKLMLARGNDEYAFRVIDRAQVPNRPVRPRKLVVVGFSTLLGLVFGMLTVLIISSERSHR